MRYSCTYFIVPLKTSSGVTLWLQNEPSSNWSLLFLLSSHALEIFLCSYFDFSAFRLIKWLELQNLQMIIQSGTSLDNISPIVQTYLNYIQGLQHITLKRWIYLDCTVNQAVDEILKALRLKVVLISSDVSHQEKIRWKQMDLLPHTHTHSDSVNLPELQYLHI